MRGRQEIGTQVMGWTAALVLPMSGCTELQNSARAGARTGTPVVGAGTGSSTQPGPVGQLTDELPSSVRSFGESILTGAAPGVFEGLDRPDWVQDLDAGRLAAVEKALCAELELEGSLPDPDELAERGGDDNRFLLELGMLRFAQGDPGAAVALLEPARRIMQERTYQTGLAYLTNGLPELMMMRDPNGDYVGADFEKLMATGMLAICEFLAHSDDADAYAYALQLQQMQEELLASSFGISDRDYYPRREYQRMALGKYLEGVFLEVRRNEDARLAYRDAATWAPDNEFLAAAAARERFAPAGHGVLHVVHLAGQGPAIRSTAREADATSEAIAQTARVAMSASELSVSQRAIAQALAEPMPVAVVEEHPWEGGDSRVLVAGQSVTMVGLLNVAAVARQQQEVFESMAMARSLLWRAAAEQAAGAVADDPIGQGLARKALGFVHRADTRCWESLPARFRVARIELPEGNHTVELADGTKAEVVIREGHTSLVTLWQRDASRPGTALVDLRSRPPRS